MAPQHESENWAVSPYNFDATIRAGMTLPPHVTICDLTLREGRQFEGVNLRKDDVILVAQKLADAGVPMIQMHHDDPEEISEIKALDLGFEIEVLIHPTAALNPETCRREVDLCLESGADIVCLAFAVSEYNFALYESMGGLSISPQEALDLAADAVRHAKQQGAKVCALLMDFSRMDLDWLITIAKTLADAGADIVRLDDICAPIIPAVYKHHVRRVKDAIPDTTIAVHSHNDFGLGAAALYASIEGGADIVDAGVNGLGERAGIPNLAEVASVVEILYGFDTGIHLEKMTDLSRLVADVWNVPLNPNLPVVGDRAFSHAAEVHYVLPESDRWSFNAWAPETVGNQAHIPWCAYSGPYGIRRKAKELDLELSESQVENLLAGIREHIRRRKRTVTDAEFRRLAATAGHDATR
jgi:isopropylmalate/homocitrate/citramalate synthase